MIHLFVRVRFRDASSTDSGNGHARRNGPDRNPGSLAGAMSISGGSGNGTPALQAGGLGDRPECSGTTNTITSPHRDCLNNHRTTRDKRRGGELGRLVALAVSKVFAVFAESYPTTLQRRAWLRKQNQQLIWPRR